MIELNKNEIEAIKTTMRIAQLSSLVYPTKQEEYFNQAINDNIKLIKLVLARLICEEKVNLINNIKKEFNKI